MEYQPEACQQPPSGIYIWAAICVMWAKDRYRQSVAMSIWCIETFSLHVLISFKNSFMKLQNLHVSFNHKFLYWLEIEGGIFFLEVGLVILMKQQEQEP